MEIVIKVLQLILALSILVFVHELGHYLAARMFGIRVDKFYIFMDVGGVSLFKFRWGETEFGLGWLPFGGYCKIAGMIDESMDLEQMKGEVQPWEFRSKPAWQRLIVMVGGVVMNVLTAIVIYIGMSLHWGDSYVAAEDLRWGWSFNELGHEVGFRDGDKILSFDGGPVSENSASVYADMVVGQVRTVGVMRGDSVVDVSISEDFTARMLNSEDFMMPRLPFVVMQPPAAPTEIMQGDSVVGVNGEAMSFRDQISSALAAAKGDTVALTVVRGVDTVVLRAPVSIEGQLGVMVNGDLANFYPVRTRSYTFLEAIPAGFRRAGQQIADYWQQLKLIVNPRTEAYKGVGSLITIGSIFPGAWEWFRFWTVTAFLSVILAVMNILPIPALDGGHVLFVLWEMISGRRPSDKFLERATTIGLYLLIALMALAFWNDIYRFFIK